MIVQNSRIQNKFSTVTGIEPTIPTTDDHTDGTWLDTDLYVGEIFINVADDLAWVRTNNGIIPITGATGAYIGDFVSASLGGTFSGDVFGTSFEAPIIESTSLINAVDINISGTATGGAFVGDGSGLTGIVATWNGGTVSLPSEFLSGVDFASGILTDSIGPHTPGSINITSDVDLGANALDTTGNITASQFIGDGSLLTGITGSANDYTIDANLVGSIIKFDRTDLVEAYEVDLSSIVGPSLSSVTWDWTINQLKHTLSDATEIDVTLDTFGDTTFNGTVTADFFVGDGSGLTGLVTVPGGLSDVLGYGNTTDGNNIILTENDSFVSSLNAGLGIYTLNDGSFDTFGIKDNSNSIFEIRQGWDMRLMTTFGSGYGLMSMNVEDQDVVIGTSNGTNGTIVSFSPGGINVVDNSVDKKGIVYNADYSATFVNRSLVDKEYVDNASSSATQSLSQVLTVGNETLGNNIVLGDDKIISATGGSNNSFFFDEGKIALWNDYTTNQEGRFELKNGASTSFLYNRTYTGANYTEGRFNFTDNTTKINVFDDSTSAESYLSQDLSGGYPTQTLLTQDLGGRISQIFLDSTGYLNLYVDDLSNSVDLSITPTDGIIVTTTNGKGIQYFTDYSSTYTNRSLVDKGYVDNAITSIGTGTTNYLTKWTGATAQGNSLIQDNGSTLSVGTALSSAHNLLLVTSANDNGITAINNKIGTGNQVGLNGQSNNASSGVNIGVRGTSTANTVMNIGVQGIASGPGPLNIGGFFQGDGATANYSVHLKDGTEGTGKFLKSVTADGKANWASLPVEIVVAASDETTALTTGTNKVTFRMPHAMTLTAVRASLTTAQTSGSIFTVDINESGTSVLSTKLTIDNTEKTSTTAATAPVISDSSLADDAEITIDIDQIGDGTAKGLKITLIGTR